MMGKPCEAGVVRQHQSHPEETEEELREQQDTEGGAGALPAGVSIKQEPPDPQELQEEGPWDMERQSDQELLFRQVARGGGGEEQRGRNGRGQGKRGEVNGGGGEGRGGVYLTWHGGMGILQFFSIVFTQKM